MTDERTVRVPDESINKILSRPDTAVSRIKLEARTKFEKQPLEYFRAFRVARRKTKKAKRK